MRPIGLFVPNGKYITPPLRAQQFIDIYRFVTMVYYYNYHNSGHYPSSCLLHIFKSTTSTNKFYRFARTS
jgi:hypothetical protein